MHLERKPQQMPVRRDLGRGELRRLGPRRGVCCQRRAQRWHAALMPATASETTVAAWGRARGRVSVRIRSDAGQGMAASGGKQPFPARSVTQLLHRQNLHLLPAAIGSGDICQMTSVTSSVRGGPGRYASIPGQSQPK